MTCHVIPTSDGPWTICGDLPADELVPCGACGAAESTRLCDGPAPKRARRETCDAPLCDACTTEMQRIPVVPDDWAVRSLHVRCSPHVRIRPPEDVAEAKRWKQLRDTFPIEHDTRDLCPRCVANGAA